MIFSHFLKFVNHTQGILHFYAIEWDSYLNIKNTLLEV